jgi:uncharacterized integral membrane protein
MADQPPKRPPNREHQTRLIVAAVLALLVLVFAIQNTTEVRVSFLFFHWDARVIYVIILSAALGAIAAWLVQRRRQRDRRGQRDERD